MSKPLAYTILVSDEAAAKAERQAEQAGWTPEMWMAWVVEEYIPADEMPLEEDDSDFRR